MDISFYEKYQTLSKDDLLEIFLNEDEYIPEALEAARQVLSEKGWKADLQKKREELNAQTEEEEELYEQEIAEKAEYYKNAVEFKNGRNSFQVRLVDIPRFEAALEERNISFFREDKNIGVQLDTYPTQSYYFKDEDVDAADALTKELSLITAPYADAKPFFKTELKMMAIAAVIMFVFLMIIYLSK